MELSRTKDQRRLKNTENNVLTMFYILCCVFIPIGVQHLEAGYHQTAELYSSEISKVVLVRSSEKRLRMYFEKCHAG